MTSFSYSRPKDLIVADTSTIDPLLVSLLSKCTPHHHEHHIVDIIKSQPYVKENANCRMYDKEMKNYIINVGDSNTVFSCHMDIVGDVWKFNAKQNKVDAIYLMECPDKSNIMQSGIYYGAKGHYDSKVSNFIINNYEGCPIGADDKVGVYILLKMIEAAIPGKYIFHTGEECGGLGSRSLAAHHPKLFKNIERAIAFDRANYGDVISFQRGSRCCSTEFGEAFAEALNTTMPPKQQFKSEVQGTFTDTASYMELVPECTNISVGYFDQHGANERFDYIWLKNFLLPQILSIDYEKLPTKRDPSKKEYKQSYTNSWNNIHVATKRKSWAEATSNTPFLEFPEWEPKLGYIEEAEPAVLKSAIGRFISINFYGPKKEEFVDWLFNLLEEKDIMQDHIKSLVNTLDKLRGEDNRVKLPSLPKEADIPFYLRHYPIKINTAREVLLTKLIIASQSEHIVLYGPYKQWLKDYTDGAKNFLKKNKEPYTKKQIEKFNRVMFSILTLLDSSEVHTKELEELLVEADNFITTNCHEEGFEVTEKLTKQLQEEAVIKLARMN